MVSPTLSGFYRSKRSRGFSLLEMLFTLLLIAILLGLTGMSLRSSIDKEGSKGLAYTLASDLRAARTEAQRSGKLVGVCFPSDNKKNSISKSALQRKGQQRGHISRLLSYGNEYDAYIFLGTWPGAGLTAHAIPDSWPISTKNEIAIMFRPDGTAFSNDLPAIDGAYPLVVGNSFQGNLNGPSGTLTAALNPHTVWVNSSGSISVEEHKLPVGTLPVGESKLVAAEPNLSNEPSPKSPVVEDVKFYPEQVPGLDTAYIGQNFVNIHPNQKDGAYLEYGMATIDIRASDLDGGPLTYTLEAKASGSENGDFTVSNLKGQMQYIFDDKLNKYVWHALISWRPPPDSPSNLVYELAVTVQDPEGNAVVIDSGAGLLPKLTSLPPSRVVVCTNPKNLYLANLDGKNEIEITKNGAEYHPFFSADGSRLYSFHDPNGTSRELRSRPADGSSKYEVLASFLTGGAGSRIQVDPTSTLAAITTKVGDISYPYSVEVHPTTTDSDGNSTPHDGCHFVTNYKVQATYKIDIVNLLTNERLAVTDLSASNGVEWSDSIKYNFSFDEIQIKPEVKVPVLAICGISGQSYVPDPGIVTPTVYKAVNGYPSQIVKGTAFTNTSKSRLYNPANPTWFIQVKESDDRVLQLGNTAGDLYTIYTAAAGIENLPDSPVAKLTPTWSADGQWVALVADPGSSSTAVVIHALNDSYSPTGTYAPTFTYSAPNLSSAQVGPEGQWVYFLDNNKIFRADNKSGSTPVNISSHFSGGVSSYVLSP